LTNQDILMRPEEISRRYYEEMDKLTRAGTPRRSFRVMVLTPGDQDWVGNGVRYGSVGEAREAADDLAMRWTQVRATTVFPSADEPNR